MNQEKNVTGYVFRKLHSLAGIIPLGLFLAFHLLANATVLISPYHYLAVIQIMTNLPGLMFLEIFVIFLPLLLHGLMGMYIVVTGRNNPHKYGYFRNWMFFLQRVSGVVIFIFLIWHLATIKFGGLNAPSMIYALQGQMTSAVGMVLYILTLLAVSLHFCNGLWGFAINWGILSGMRAQKYFGYICVLLFVLLAIFWFSVMLGFIG